MATHSVSSKTGEQLGTGLERPPVRRKSAVRQLGSVPFPAFTGERVYMRAFTKAGGLPPDLVRWQPTVDAMLDGIAAPGPVYLMVDQAPVRAGAPQRRPGVHVDGYWWPGLSCHGQPTEPSGPAHHGKPTPPRHVMQMAGRHGPTPGHTFGDGSAEAIILASDVLGCAAYEGDYVGAPGEGGDCSHVDVSALGRVELEPGRAWTGHTLTMLHESIPLVRDSLRTMVRLSVPGWVHS